MPRTTISEEYTSVCSRKESDLMRKTLFLFLLMMFVRMVSFGQTNVIEQKKANKLNMQENRVTVLLETTVGNIKIAINDTFFSIFFIYLSLYKKFLRNKVKSYFL